MSTSFRFETRLETDFRDLPLHPTRLRGQRPITSSISTRTLLGVLTSLLTTMLTICSITNNSHTRSFARSLNDVKHAADTRHITLAVFFDFSMAFDNDDFDHYLLIENLSHWISLYRHFIGYARILRADVRQYGMTTTCRHFVALGVWFGTCFTLYNYNISIVMHSV